MHGSPLLSIIAEHPHLADASLWAQPSLDDLGYSLPVDFTMIVHSCFGVSNVLPRPVQKRQQRQNNFLLIKSGRLSQIPIDHINVHCFIRRQHACTLNGQNRAVGRHLKLTSIRVHTSSDTGANAYLIPSMQRGIWRGGGGVS